MGVKIYDAKKVWQNVRIFGENYITEFAHFRYFGNHLPRFHTRENDIWIASDISKRFNYQNICSVYPLWHTFFLTTQA